MTLGRLARHFGPLVPLALVASVARAAPTDATVPPVLTINKEVGAVRELKLEAGQNRLLVLSEAAGRVFVADPTVADLKVVTPNQLLLTAKGVGNTDMTLWTKAEEPLVIALEVTRNLEGLRKQLADLFPKETVTVGTAGDLVVLTGEVSDVRLPERIAEVAKLHSGKVANLVHVAGDQQVQLEVKFAEVSRSGMREMGVNFFHKGADYRNTAGVFGSRTPAGSFLRAGQTGTIDGPLGRFGGQPPEVPGQPFGNAFSLFLSSFNSAFPFSFIVNLLESNGLSKTLAEPTLVALSGQEAKFMAGGEFPIPVASTLGQVNVQWKKFGVLLSFTPTVIAADTIHLHLSTEVSDIDPNASITVGGSTIPGLTSRQGETTVRLGDGQSFAIAGLLSNKIRSQIDQVPFLGQIPILGTLFRSTEWQRDETELLVIVTARLARPVAPHELPKLPTDDENNDPSSVELLLFGWDSAEPPENDHKPAAKPVAAGRGPSGLIGFSR
jgi:pilus assembly protein CpaC